MFRIFFKLCLLQKSMVIYNSLRYDVDLHVVKFHLVEKDWKELNETSWLKIETNNGQPLITSNTVFLENKSGTKLLKVTQVDPVATFGLFSVQRFNVCSSQENHLLEVCCLCNLFPPKIFCLTLIYLLFMFMMRSFIFTKTSICLYQRYHKCSYDSRACFNIRLKVAL